VSLCVKFGWQGVSCGGLIPYSVSKTSLVYPAGIHGMISIPGGSAHLAWSSEDFSRSVRS